MKPFFVLYVKELKAHKILFFFFFLLIVGMNAYGLIQLEYFLHILYIIKSFGDIDPQVFQSNNFSYFWGPMSMLAAFILIFSLPFLLAHAFNTEWKSETHYQMFALPVPQYIVNLAKVAVVASKGIVGVGVGLVIGSLYLWIGRKVGFLDSTMELMSVPRVALVIGLIFVTSIVFILGVVTGMEGVKFAVKRYRGLTAITFFLIAVFLYGQLLPQGIKFFEFSGQISMPTPANFTIGLAPFVYTILMGIIFMIIGLVVYEKRAEI
ncbi:MAG: hypothetical protein OXN20_10445 [Gemmatimonadota bacterium]|nr:hypothetical protein [Gemmatimonadota bacterium]